MRTSVAHSLIFLLCLSACRQESKPAEPVAAETTETLFTAIPSAQSGINFQNTLTEGLNTNILMYEYFYNGAGVAAGDINDDGLIDLYFSSNMGKGKLFLNEGNFKFKDITSSAHVNDRDGPWKTGVCMADVNGDGRLDIFLAYSGMVKEENRANQLFINQGINEQGIPTFAESAANFGLASTSFTNLAYFFDYDNDHDIDALLLNHNPRALPVLNEVSTAEMLRKDDPWSGVRLLKNTNDHFDDVTVKSGINGSALTYGLGAGISDLNNDGWLDIYISNDYAVPDYLYINNRNGTFTNRLKESIGHNSHFSMGNDVGDVNNDGWMDIITLDMLPQDNKRQKLLLAPDNYGKFDFNVSVGFHYQYMRNMLQLNNGNNSFSEVGQISGISNTDWSWAALLADYDNDGWKDLAITNGYLRDYTNLDFVKYMDDYVRQKGRLAREDVIELIQRMPASNVSNYIFSGSEGLIFTDQTKAWGMSAPSNSNGAAYADLDNDGDLDMVANNINQPAFVYRNNSKTQNGNHHLDVKLVGDGKNTLGIGARVMIIVNGKKQYLEQVPTRGYLSGVSPVLHFGIAGATAVDTLLVSWPGGRLQTLTNIPADQLVELKESESLSRLPTFAGGVFMESEQPQTYFKPVPSPLKATSIATDVNDFKRQPLMINPFSFSGPCMKKGDVNNDGLEDILLGGASGVPTEIHIQNRVGNFSRRTVPAFDKDKAFEDADIALFDANGDGAMDVYVASGGYHSIEPGDASLQDRLYLGDGKGGFTRAVDALPLLLSSKGCVEPFDINLDGYVDIFVGGRVVPGRYPEIPRSYILINDGTGKFADQTSTYNSELQHLGMVTDAIAVDLNKDQKSDLVVVGDWMPMKAYISDGKSLRDESTKYFGAPRAGWWNKIAAGDVNGDGVPDLVAGNMGTNTQFRVSEQEPAELYYKDFDDNGSIDPIFCYYIQGRSYPYVTRDELLEQLGSFRKRYTNYESYANATLDQLFTAEQLSTFSKFKATHLETSLFLSNANGTWSYQPLPLEAQYSPVCSIVIVDGDKDGSSDLLLTGNINRAKLRLGKFDANYGVFLKGDGKGGFTYVNQVRSGLNLKGDVRSAIHINNVILFGINGKGVEAYRLTSNPE
jgi:hypothetical protein